MATTLLPQLEKMVEATSQGKLPWKSANQNMARWSRAKGSRLYTVTVQVQILPSARRNYLFTIQATMPSEVVVQLNTATDTAYEGVLSKLFDAAMIASKDGGGKVIDDLLSGL